MAKNTSKAVTEEIVLAEIKELKVVIADKDKFLKSLILPSATNFNTAIAIRDVAQEIADAYLAIKQKELQLKCIKSGIL